MEETLFPTTLEGPRLPRQPPNHTHHPEAASGVPAVGEANVYCTF
jgi:hypothetical protein